MFYKKEEIKELLVNYHCILKQIGEGIQYNQLRALKEIMYKAVSEGIYKEEIKGINPVIRNIQTAQILCGEMGLRHASVISVLLYDLVAIDYYDPEAARKVFGNSTYSILQGLKRAHELYNRNALIETENFRNLLLSFAQDGRVILIMIADRLNMMRNLKKYPESDRVKLAREASFLFAPLAHRMGLYGIKTEMEDLSMKYIYPSVYTEIARKLAETKASRDKYIDDFITPVEKRIEKLTNYKFDIKGRTKSINSIWNKLKKQKIPFEKIYDLFAIRIILDVPVKKEKAACWQVYSIITDMYTPNTARLKDWISIPKSNGYESLHITVMGQEGKWVEVQIRTKRMDEIAERGVAAHWKYKGIKSEAGLDAMLTHIREILERTDTNSMDLLDEFKMNLYEDEVYVFSPRGEVYKLPKGATVLDFAYAIHSNLGDKCIGAKVDGKNVPIRYFLKSGDQVEIQTGNNQVPKPDWINFVVTSKARNKIKQSLKEQAQKQVDYGKENFSRRLKNRKIEYNESVLMRTIRKLKYKTVTAFFEAIGNEDIDVNNVIDKYLEILNESAKNFDVAEVQSAGNFVADVKSASTEVRKKDVLLIDQELSGIDYKLAKCCNPIYGDPVFAFVSATGGIKIHRADCPNAKQMRERFPYRILEAKWAGKFEGSSYPVTLMVVGNDDIGIVVNITSLLSKEPNVTLRSISIDSHDGLFKGQLTILVSDLSHLASIIKKIETVKGVKQVIR